MQTIETHMEARAAITDYRADSFADLPERFRARFKDYMNSPAPVDQYVKIGEFIYANRADMPDSAKLLAASLLSFATNSAWHGLQDDERGLRIVANLRKDIGEIKTAPAAPDPAFGMRLEPEAPAQSDAVE